jgi:trimethylamine--corrinoid protein Co-methyltransferase
MKPSHQTVLSEKEMQKLHAASLTILQDVGMQIDHAESLGILHDAGAHVDRSNNRVKFPPDMVERCLRQIPSSVCLAGRDPKYDLMLRYDSPFVARCGTGLTAILEPQGTTCRDAVPGDQATMARLVDGLDNIGMPGPLTLHDVPGKTADLHATRLLLEGQRKHFMNLTMGPRNMRYQIEMQLAVRGSRAEVANRPLFHPISCLISPLYMPGDAIDIMMIAGEYGLPVKIPVMPMLGASAPVTLAGILAHGNAEVLGSFTVLQTLCPGNPTLYYMVPTLMDMRSGGAVYGAPENILLYAALTQMARMVYKVPSDTTSLFCDGVLLEQNTYQKGCLLQAAALFGANIVSGAGTVDGGMAFSAQQLVIDNEIIGLTKRMLAGFTIDDDSLGLDCVRRVGPKGNFLLDPHTLENFRSGALFAPSIFSYQNFSTWQQSPKQFSERAEDVVQGILASHEVPPLEDHVVNELKKIVKAADKEIAGC